MNLLTRETNESIIRHFRVHQYMLYPDMIKLSMEYLIKFGLAFDPLFYDVNKEAVNIEQDYSYHGESYYAADLLTIELFPKAVNSDKLLHAYIPRLIDETFFHLNGGFFIPIFFISDEPIVLKAESISIYSLFQPISLYIKDKRVTFMQDNYELADFLQMIIHDWHPIDIQLIENKLGITLNPKRETVVFNIFANKFKCDPDPNEIKLKMNQLIFDDWTYELYEKYYGITPTIDLLIKIAFDRLIDGFQPKFGDLRYKRLTFVEQIMKGFFKHISISTKMLINNKSVRTLMFPQNGFTKHFFTMLDGQSFYDTVNGFSSILSHKATFKNPAASSKLPKSVSELHPSHKCRICSNTITNTKPGQMVSLVPDQEIDLRFGIFEQHNYELRHLTR